MSDKAITTNQTIDGVPRELKPCPFCGHPAKLDVEEVRGDDAWCFIRCSWRCKAAPHIGEHACVWYWSEGKKHRHQSDEKAKEQAKEYAINAWNTRHEPAAQPQCDTVPVSAHWSDWSMVTLEIEGQHRTYVEYGKSQGDPVAIVVEQTHNYGNFLVFGSSIPGVQRPAPVVERKAHLLDQSLPTGTKLYAEQPAPVATIALIVGAIHDIPGFPGITGIQIRQLAERLNAKSR